MASILVVHASKYGSTREVAEKVAEVLSGLGHEVVTAAASDIRNMESYSAVVLGGALYFFRWRKDARRFLSRNRKALAGLPVAVFAMGPIEDTPEQFVGARQQLDKALAKEPWLTPASVAIFGGRFDPSGLRFPDANPAMKNMPAGDLRDWSRIQSWAESLEGALGLAGPRAGE